MTGAKSRIESAREAAHALVDALELGKAPILECLMIAQRLARFMRDEGAQLWLQYEIGGYPGGLDSASLGTSARYAFRWHPDKSVFTTSLPSLEASVVAARGVCEAMQAAPTSDGKPIDNFLVARATEKVMATRAEYIASSRDAYVAATNIFSRMKGAIHRYAADTLIALELGDTAEELFEAARTDVDLFVRAHCPTAAEQLNAASDRLRDGAPEALSQALTSCRRVLLTVADAVFPARGEPYIDGCAFRSNVTGCFAPS